MRSASMRNIRSQGGVMLIEALIGILIFSIGVLAMIGLQASAMRATIDAKYRSEASFLANEIIGAMWVDRGNLTDYATSPGTPATCPGSPVCAWLTRVQTLMPQASGANAPSIDVSGQQATVTVRWQHPGEGTVSNHVAVATINDS